jgi:hypothetical protein
VSGAIVIVRLAAVAGAVSPSRLTGVAAIEDNAENDSVNATMAGATTAGIYDFVFMAYSSKKEEWRSPQVCEELQWYFAPWRVKTELAVR